MDERADQLRAVLGLTATAIALIVFGWLTIPALADKLSADLPRLMAAKPEPVLATADERSYYRGLYDGCGAVAMMGGAARDEAVIYCNWFVSYVYHEGRWHEQEALHFVWPPNEYEEPPQ